MNLIYKRYRAPASEHTNRSWHVVEGVTVLTGYRSLLAEVAKCGKGRERGGEGGVGWGWGRGSGRKMLLALSYGTLKFKAVARLKFHVGWSGWTRPPTMAGGGWGALAKTKYCAHLPAQNHLHKSPPIAGTQSRMPCPSSTFWLLSWTWRQWFRVQGFDCYGIQNLVSCI